MMTGTETILLAEDDATLRTFFRNILTEHGYTVVVAEDGEDAIRKFIERKDEIQLCVLDMIMPKKSGKEVFEAIQKMKPGIKVLFSSGYTADKVLQRRAPCRQHVHCETGASAGLSQQNPGGARSLTWTQRSTTMLCAATPNISTDNTQQFFSSNVHS